MNPFPNNRYTTDIGDGLRMLETRDRGHCYRIVEPEGTVSGIIAVNAPPPKPVGDKPFHVRPRRQHPGDRES
jgi:hypothetical protein